jgi:ABC-type cobalamin transport system permease subunit
MNRTIHPLARLTALATAVLGLVLVAASRAVAMNPVPDPGGAGGAGGVPEGPSAAAVQPITDNSVSALQWVAFVVAVLGALAIGAALMNLAQRRRSQLAH